MSIVRENLMTREGYSPYCGNIHCSTTPRTSWTGKQFKCGSCGWVSSFPPDFIAEYKAKWDKGSNATMTIGGVDLPVRVCDAQAPWSGFDPAEPGSDRTVIWPPLPESVSVQTTEEVVGDTKRFFDAMFEATLNYETFDPWADTHRLNDLGRAPNRQRDIAEFECRFVMRGTPLVVTKAQAKELEAIEFDQALYATAESPFDVIVVGGGRSSHKGMAALLPPAERVQRQFEVLKTATQDRLRDRWGRLKR